MRTAEAIPPPQRLIRIRRSAKNFLINTVVILVSIAISLTLLETGVRLFISNPTPNLDLFRPNHKYLFLSNPGASGVIPVSLGNEQTIEINHHFSSQGFRDRLFGPKQNGEFRILMLGDSFTQGHAVAEAETIPKYLEAFFSRTLPEKNISVVNAGLLSAGPLQELGMLREYGYKVDPDLVVLQLFPANDLSNALMDTGRHFRAYWPQEWQIYQTLLDADTIPARAERWSRSHIYTYRAILNIEMEPYVATILGLVFPTSRSQFNLFDDPPENRRFEMEANLTNWYKEISDGFEIMKKEIEAIRDDCSRHAIPLAVYCIPQTLDVYDRIYERNFPAAMLAQYERGKALKKTERFLRDNNYASVSILEALRKLSDDESLYLIMDGHLSAKGNRIVAELIGNYLMDNHFIR